MAITTKVEVDFEYKIEEVNINVVLKVIFLKIRKTGRVGETIVSSSIILVEIEGNDFLSMASAIPDNTKTMYENIANLSYNYCVSNNKLV